MLDRALAHGNASVQRSAHHKLSPSFSMLPCFVGKCVSRSNLRKAVGSSVGSGVGRTWKGRLDEKIAEVCLSCAARKQ